MVWALRIPGAIRVSVRFHPASSLADGDRVVLYKSKLREEDDVWGSFGASSDWPGTGNKEPLEITSGVVYVGFFSASGQGQTPWGFKLFASATHFRGEALQPSPTKFKKKKTWNNMITAAKASKHLHAEFSAKETLMCQENERLAMELAAVTRQKEVIEKERETWVQRLNRLKEGGERERQTLEETVRELQEEVMQLKEGGKIELFEQIAHKQANQRASAQVKLHKELNKQEVEENIARVNARSNVQARRRNSLVAFQRVGNKVVTGVKVTGVARAGRVALKQQTLEQKKKYEDQVMMVKNEADEKTNGLLKEIYNKEAASPQQVKQTLFLGAMTMDKSELDSMHHLLDLSRQAVSRVTKTVLEETKYNIHAVEKEVIKGVIESNNTYKKAAQWLELREADALRRLQHLPNEGSDEKEGMRLQSPNCGTVEGLLAEAAETQQMMRSMVICALGENGVGVGLGDGQGVGVGEDISKHWSTKKEFRVQADWASSLFDPSTKSIERTNQKVEYKYSGLTSAVGGTGGKRQEISGYRRVHDAARLAVICADCDMVLKAVEQIKRTFDVVELQNRHREPTVLGWADVTMLVNVPLGDRWHVGEIQVQHNHYFRARLTVHQHYVALRNSLPDKCKVKASELEKVQKLICEQVQRLIDQTEWNVKRTEKKRAKLRKKPKGNFMAPTKAALARVGDRDDDRGRPTERRPSLEGRRGGS
jgi:hypothetical protein